MSAVGLSKKQTNRMYQARIEIEKGNYFFAMKILRGIDDPQARLWEAKINRKMQRERQERQDEEYRRNTQRNTKIKLAIMVILIMASVLIYKLNIEPQQLAHHRTMCTLIGCPDER